MDNVEDILTRIDAATDALIEARAQIEDLATQLAIAMTHNQRLAEQVTRNNRAECVL